MSDDEIEFKKYKNLGAYHWIQISAHPVAANAFVKGRYQMCVRLLKKFGPLRGKKIVDMGCGDGVLAYVLAKEGASVVGVDSSEIAVGYAREKHTKYGTGASFIVGDCYNTGLADALYDFVVCSDVIEHLSKPQSLLTEIQRVLRPGGVVVLSTPIRLAETPADSMHKVEWFNNEFICLIKQTFPNARGSVSHPVFWMELLNISLISRVFVNILSMIWNPFLSGKGWRHYALQYAVAVKR